MYSDIGVSFHETVPLSVTLKVVLLNVTIHVLHMYLLSKVMLYLYNEVQVSNRIITVENPLPGHYVQWFIHAGSTVWWTIRKWT